MDFFLSLELFVLLNIAVPTNCIDWGIPSKLLGGITMLCPVCEDHAPVQKSFLSDVAWKALVSWEESPKSYVDEKICKDCYLEFRDILIERSEEFEEFQKQYSNPTK